MQDWKAKQAAKASAAAAMQAAFPDLVPVGGSVDSLNAAAKNIRIELKRAFPKIKFSVKSERFSMGDAIRVGWIDGPNSDQVEEITGKYKAGSFNSMEDLYEYGKDAWNDAFGDAKFITCRREDSDKAIESAIRSVFAKYAMGDIAQPSVAEYKRGACWSVPIWNENLQSLIGQVLWKRVWCIAKAVPVAEMEAEAA